jgi:hypothetical protein
LIPSKPPKEAIERRRTDANARFRGEYVHTIPNSSEGPSDGGPGKPAGQASKPPRGQFRKGSKKQQRPGPKAANGNGKTPGVGYRPGRRVP